MSLFQEAARLADEWEATPDEEASTELLNSGNAMADLLRNRLHAHIQQALEAALLKAHDAAIEMAAGSIEQYDEQSWFMLQQSDCAEAIRELKGKP